MKMPKQLITFFNNWAPVSRFPTLIRFMPCGDWIRTIYKKQINTLCIIHTKMTRH